MNLTEIQKQECLYAVFFFNLGKKSAHSEDFLFLNKNGKVDIKNIKNFSYDDFNIEHNLNYFSPIENGIVHKINFISPKNFFYLHEKNKKEINNILNKSFQDNFCFIKKFIPSEQINNIASLTKTAFLYNKAMGENIQETVLKNTINDSKYKYYYDVFQDIKDEIK